MSIPESEQLHVGAWCEQMSSDYLQFYYWYKVWQLDLLLLQFLGSQREQNYVAYVVSPRKRLFGCLLLIITSMLVG